LANGGSYLLDIQQIVYCLVSPYDDD